MYPSHLGALAAVAVVACVATHAAPITALVSPTGSADAGHDLNVATGELLADIHHAPRSGPQVPGDHPLAGRQFHRILAEVPGNPIFVALHEAFVEKLMKRRRLPEKAREQMTE